MDPVLVAIEPARSGLQGEARLAGPTGADEREEAADRVIEMSVDRGQLVRPADEGGPRGGQVGAPRFERPQRRELGRQALDLELEDPLRGAEVLEPVWPEVTSANLDERPRGLRQEDLAAVANGGDARSPVDVDPDVAIRGWSRLAGVESHTDLDHATGQRPLGLHRRRDGLRGPCEREEERVALGVDLCTSVGGDGFPDDATMLGQGVRVGVSEVAQQPRRTLDVGEQEGDLAGRKLAGHRVSDDGSRPLPCPADSFRPRCSWPGLCAIPAIL